jgi:16S rRNA (cytosine1402-N4)-methyltransferase
MVEEILAWLNPRPGGVYADGTLGGAGHAQQICRRIQPDGLFIGIDRDADAIANAAIVLEPFAARVRLFHASFVHLPQLLQQAGVPAVDGLLLDLGLSLHQLEASGRGFSFQRDEPLDMRMDTRDRTTAATLVNTLGEAELAAMLFAFGEERGARRIARAVVAQRRRAPITTSG